MASGTPVPLGRRNPTAAYDDRFTPSRERPSTPRRGAPATHAGFADQPKTSVSAAGSLAGWCSFRPMVYSVNSGIATSHLVESSPSGCPRSSPPPGRRCRGTPPPQPTPGTRPAHGAVPPCAPVPESLCAPVPESLRESLPSCATAAARSRRSSPRPWPLVAESHQASRFAPRTSASIRPEELRWDSRKKRLQADRRSRSAGECRAEPVLERPRLQAARAQEAP